MVKKDGLYLFMTLGYYFSGRVDVITPTHVAIREARIHYEDVGDLDTFTRDFGKYKPLPRGYIVPMSGTGVLPLEDTCAVSLDPAGVTAGDKAGGKKK